MNDIKATAVAATGSVFAGRARIRGLVVSLASGAGGAVTFTDGSGGSTKLSIVTLAPIAANTHEDFVIPDHGILCPNGIYLSALPAGAKVTVYFS